MLPLENLGTWRLLLEGEAWQLFAYSRTIDRLRHGPTAATALVLRNCGRVPLHLRNMEVRWSAGAPLAWGRPGLVEPEGHWILLDTRSFDALVALARQGGRRGFGVGGTLHEVTVHLDQPRLAQLTFGVCWGFATPDYDLGFFLPLLDDT